MPAHPATEVFAQNYRSKFWTANEVLVTSFDQNLSAQQIAAAVENRYQDHIRLDSTSMNSVNDILAIIQKIFPNTVVVLSKTDQGKDVIAAVYVLPKGTASKDEEPEESEEPVSAKEERRELEVRRQINALIEESKRNPEAVLQRLSVVTNSPPGDVSISTMAFYSPETVVRLLRYDFNKTADVIVTKYGYMGSVTDIILPLSAEHMDLELGIVRYMKDNAPSRESEEMFRRFAYAAADQGLLDALTKRADALRRAMNDSFEKEWIQRNEKAALQDVIAVGKRPPEKHSWTR